MTRYLFEGADRMCKREIKPSRLHEHTKMKKNDKRSLNESVSRRGKRSLKEAFVDYDPTVVLFDTMDRIEIDRNGDFEDAEFISYDELMDDWASPSDNFSEEDYQDAIDEIISLLKNVKLYSDDGVVYLQLSDNHTLWDINFTDEMDIEYTYPEFVNGAAERFWSETGERLYYLGRSGRHVCVGYTWDNLVNYDYLQGVQQRLEKEIVDYFNGEYDRIKSAKTNESLKSHSRRRLKESMSEEEIRRNWEKALKTMPTEQISAEIEWGFDLDDIFKLMRLHKAGKYREEIEDLFEDCNFHSLVSNLKRGIYEYEDEYSGKVIRYDENGEVLPFR